MKLNCNFQSAGQGPNQKNVLVAEVQLSITINTL